jgi:acylphosphatase
VSEGPERAVRLIVTGRVQGVSYRAFVEREARALHLRGYVRNRRDGGVEAVLSGSASDVERMIAACRRGPPASMVEDVQIVDYSGPPVSGFRILPTG